MTPDPRRTSFAPRKGMSDLEIETTITEILAQATLEEKVAMMSGHGVFQQFKESGNRWGAHPYRAGGGCDRLGVPAFYFTDGPRGVARGESTCFPSLMARGASFDPDLERRVGEAMAIEARAQGCNLSGAVCVNLLRHPAWGRAQETYGEDTYHVGVMGSALAQGLQVHNVVATVKHFALNSIENTRFKVNVLCDDRTMREVYLPHFKAILDAGCASVMSAYNKWNGEYCGQNRTLLTDILRNEWGFEGFVHSDWVRGVYQPYGAAAGLDVENPEPIHFGRKLVDAVRSGAIEPEVVNRACRRILTTLYRFAAAEDPLPHYGADLVACPAHISLAREAAEKSAVLLENDGVLPFDAASVKTLAVLGRLAAIENTGDHGSSRVRPPYVITPLQGLTQYLQDARIVTGDERDLPGAEAAAAASDAVVVVVGTTRRDEGEYIPADVSLGAEEGGVGVAIGGDRDSLELARDQIALIEAAARSGKPMVVVIVSGSAIMTESWRKRTNAILQVFYSGMEGGAALSRLLFGDVSPAGRLPFTVARNAHDYPYFDKTATEITYGPYHGYTLFDRAGSVARYPFGHGLSYARFVYRALKVRRAAGAIETTVSVRNDGRVAADEVAQLYVSPPAQTVERPARLLKGFHRLRLAPGETKTIRLVVRLDDVRWWNPSTRSWMLESGRYVISVGGSSASDALIAADISL